MYFGCAIVLRQKFSGKTGIGQMATEGILHLLCAYASWVPFFLPQALRIKIYV